MTIEVACSETNHWRHHSQWCICCRINRVFVWMLLSTLVPRACPLPGGAHIWFKADKCYTLAHEGGLK